MLRKLLTTCVVLYTYFPVSAQTDSTVKEEKPKPIISGSVDIYYRYNFDKQLNNFTSFTNSYNTFSLGMASVKVEHAWGKVGGVIDLGFGSRAREFAYNNDAAQFMVKQAYMSYAANEKWKFSIGSWATHIGYEMVDPQLDKEYSMSYMFTNGPFFHTGVKAEYTSGPIGLMLGITNPTDFRAVVGGGADADPKFIIGQISFPQNDVWKVYVNWQSGKFEVDPDYMKHNKIKQLDVVASCQVGAKTNLAFNGTAQHVSTKGANKRYGDKEGTWWGTALYAYHDITPVVSINARAEFIGDAQQVKFASSNISEYTLSSNLRVKGLTIVPEIRLDYAKDGVFLDAAGNAKKSTVSALVAAIYQF